MTISAEESHLSVALQYSVPLYIAEIKQAGRIPYSAQKNLEEVAELIASEGDNLLFGEGKKGRAGELFNKLAWAIACLAFNPGGVHVCGLHFEARFPQVKKKN